MNISVIIPVYKAEKFLAKAVESALQFDEVKEVLLIEDASPDNSLQIANELSEVDQRVQVLQHHDKKNHGAGASRNLGIENASQDFIAFLDADDYYLPNRFEAEKELFKQDDIEGVFGALGNQFYDEEGKERYQKKFNREDLTTVNYSLQGKPIFYKLLGLEKDFGVFFHLDTLTLRKKSVDTHQLRFNPQLKLHQDQDFIIKAAYYLNLSTGIIDKPIAIRGIHANNRITTITKFSDNFNLNQNKLWQSIDEFVKDKPIKKEYKEYVALKNKAFELSTKKGLNKYSQLFKEVLKQPKILKTRYRYHYLNK